MARRSGKRVTKRRVGRRPSRSTRRESRAISIAPRRLHNLPTQLTTFIGREQEIIEIKRLLGTTPLLTLTGAGGCGKTRLALQVASDLVADFRDGVWMVDLAPLVDAALVPQAVAKTVGVPEQTRRSLLDTLTDYLWSRALLLVLDNCEHVLASCADLAHALVRECPDLRILATSREPLGVAGEIRWTVPSLSLPTPEKPPSTGELMKSDAVRLFITRAVAVQSNFTVSDSSIRAVADLCQQLDGIPLAIEMAAAWVRVLTVEDILKRLSDRFRLLRSEHRNALARHQTLKTAMDWSYALLSEQERALLRRLSVFSGGWSLAAAEAVCVASGIETAQVLDLLTRLVDKSLVLVEPRQGQAHYRLLETIRQYAWERLAEARETMEFRRRHRDWYLALAERGEPELRSAAQLSWLRRFETEHDNLRAALGLCSEEEGNGAGAELRLAASLEWFWYLRGHWSEGRRWLDEAIARSGDVPSPPLAKALRGAAFLALRQGDVERATRLSESGLTVSLAVGDKKYAAWSLMHLGMVATYQNDFERATTVCEDALVIARESGDTWFIALAIAHLGDVAQRKADYDQAAAYYSESVALFRETGDKSYTALFLRHLGDIELHQERHEQAAASYREGLILANEVEARRETEECIAGLAQLASARGDYQTAAKLFGSAETQRVTLGLRREPHEQAYYDQSVGAAQVALGEGTFAAAFAEGRATALDQATEYAIASSQMVQNTRKAPAIHRPKTGTGFLAPRERAVAALIVEGKSNREIAATLSIAESTAETHVQHILNKLGFNSRTQIAAWAVSHGLQPRS